ncbi:hypothetical protein ACUX20_23025 [Salmonella enterica]
MKLIDLLVQELPKLGGWPDGAEYARVSYFGVGKILVDFRFPDAYGELSYCIGVIARNLIDTGTDVDYHMIRRDSYESALAASQKPAWNGEGLPPVGCECECHVDEGVIHCIVVGYDFDGKAVVMRNVPARKYFSIQANSGRIKPLRTEAERKREAVVEKIKELLMFDYGDDPRINDATFIYDAIAAGKIPGVKLDD